MLPSPPTTATETTKIIIQNNEPYQNFINTLNSEYTQRSYKRALKDFLSFMNIEDYDSSKLLSYEIKTIETFIRDYILDMRMRRNLSPSTIDCNCAAIKHFFDINDVDLRWSKKLVKFKGNKDTHYNNNSKNGIRAYTLEEVRKLLNSA